MHVSGFKTIPQRLEEHCKVRHSGYFDNKCAACLDLQKRGKPEWIDYCHLITSSKRRNLEVTISFVEFIRLVNQKCEYGDCSNDINIGIDRKDNSLGYVEGNCASCCWFHNRMKNDIFSYDEMCRLLEIFPHLRVCKNKTKKESEEQ